MVMIGVLMVGGTQLFTGPIRPLSPIIRLSFIPVGRSSSSDVNTLKFGSISMGEHRRVNVRVSASASALAKDKTLKSLESIQVYDPSGARVSLTSLWENRRAVVAFTRHFGCLLCRKRAALLEARKAEMDAAGVALVVIAPGVPEQAQKFLETTKFSGEVYADPESASYEALDFTKGTWSTFNPKSSIRLVQARMEGYRQDWGLSLGYKDTVQKGGWQQGGILVAGPRKENIVYLFKDAEAGDEPQMDDVISACCRS